MIERLLIANRGEIACRIAQTARRMGIEVIAVYSSVDRHARHVRMADRAYAIGGASAQASYLNADSILSVAQASGADAIHPGYGFLAENATFAQQVLDAGYRFIGPSPKTIEMMGSKAAAKALMVDAGVPVLPGYHGDDQSDATLEVNAQSIGFPLMIKAAAGGGGKGMRVVHDPSQWGEALLSARREAQSAFGDDRVILERYLPKPKHIEAQIFGDTHGHVIHLYERDCSSQRRHQKIIEEAPASGLEISLRQSLCQAAVDAARTVDYVGAGTVEFLVDEAHGAFYFLEMNTRLQVEHPVTEAITGLDLVEWQLRVAMGEPLPQQETITPPMGHAIEARVYAEDPLNQFLPSTGRIRALHWPSDIRVDSGVDEHDTISIHYDPMIAKLIVHGDDRSHALGLMAQALDQCFVDGPKTNLGFLQSLCQHPALQSGAVDTGFLDRELPDWPYHHRSPPTPESPAMAAAVVAGLLIQETDAQIHQPTSPWSACDGQRFGLPPVPRHVRIQAEPDGVIWPLKVWGQAGSWQIETAEGHRHTWQWTRDGDTGSDGALFGQITVDNQAPQSAWMHRGPHGLTEVCLNHQRHRWIWLGDEESASTEPVDEGHIKAPMPGQVIDVRIELGQSVARGDVLIVIEAMKMEVAIKAPCDGTVTSLTVSSGDRVAIEAEVVTIEPHITAEDASA